MPPKLHIEAKKNSSLWLTSPNYADSVITRCLFADNDKEVYNARAEPYTTFQTILSLTFACLNIPWSTEECRACVKNSIGV